MPHCSACVVSPSSKILSKSEHCTLSNPCYIFHSNSIGSVYRYRGNVSAAGGLMVEQSVTSGELNLHANGLKPLNHDLITRFCSLQLWLICSAAWTPPPLRFLPSSCCKCSILHSHNLQKRMNKACTSSRSVLLSPQFFMNAFQVPSPNFSPQFAGCE